MQSKRAAVLLVITLMVLIPDRAFGYLDPGTGSIIIQLVVAGALGALFTIKNFYRNIKEFISGVFRGKSNNDQNAPQ